MIDTREQILSRLVEVARTVVDSNCVFRNQIEIPERRRPAVIILDGDENADDAGQERGRPAKGPKLVSMEPEIFILVEGRPDSAAKAGEEKVGGALNKLRAALIEAVVNDATLVALCTNGDIRYDGFATSLAAGRSMEGEAAINLSFRYVLRPVT